MKRKLVDYTWDGNGEEGKREDGKEKDEIVKIRHWN